MRHMTSYIAKALFTILISGGMLATSLQAQYLSGAEATIPFAFAAQRQDMDAGTYQLRSLSDPFLLAIHKVGTGGDFIFTVRSQDSPSVPSHGYLTFRRNAGHLYLAEIHLQGTHTYIVVIQRQKQKRDTVNAKIDSSNTSTNVALR